MSICVVESKASIGHVNFYNIYYNDLAKSNTVEVLSYSSIFEKLKVKEKIIKTIFFREQVFKSKISYHLYQIYFSYKAIKFAKKNGFEKIIFSVYDTFSIGIIACFFPHLLSSIKVELFEHNNIDQLKTSKIKSLLYKLTSKYVKSIVFENYIGEHINLVYQREFYCYPHPLIMVNSDNVNKDIDKRLLGKDYVFLPSAAINKAELETVYEFCTRNRLLLVCKKNSLLNNFPADSFIAETYFENYQHLLLNCKYLAVANDFSYRVSAVFYEGIANDLNIIIADNLMARKLSLKYKESEILILNRKGG
jgi:hypothetical protein